MQRSDAFQLTRRSALLGAGSAVLVVAGSASAAEPVQSAWSQASHSGIRLLAGGPVAGTPSQHRAGIHIRMHEGFKTYWRHPGDSGVPPVFRFEGSQNLKSAVVRFPAPVKFADGAGGHSYGYHGPDVVLPLEIVAVDPGKPVHLHLQMDYAVCEKLCVPASGQAKLVISRNILAGMHPALLQAEKRVPSMHKMAEGDVLKVMGLRKAAEPEHFLVDVILPAKAQPVLFIEGESPWFMETKSFTQTGDDKGTFLVAVIEKSKAVDCTGADLTLTLVTEKNAIEVSNRLDVALIAP
ncbi:MAG: protein-disulfide reductase DsbD domain-containing protein [Beijerinckiaceae bacterium]